MTCAPTPGRHRAPPPRRRHIDAASTASSPWVHRSPVSERVDADHSEAVSEAVHVPTSHPVASALAESVQQHDALVANPRDVVRDAQPPARHEVRHRSPVTDRRQPMPAPPCVCGPPRLPRDSGFPTCRRSPVASGQGADHVVGEGDDRAGVSAIEVLVRVVDSDAPPEASTDADGGVTTDVSCSTPTRPARRRRPGGLGPAARSDREHRDRRAATIGGGRQHVLGAVMPGASRVGGDRFGVPCQTPIQRATRR